MLSLCASVLTGWHALKILHPLQQEVEELERAVQSKEQLFAEKLRRQLCDLVEQLEAFKADRSQLQLHVELLQVLTPAGQRKSRRVGGGVREGCGGGDVRSRGARIRPASVYACNACVRASSACSSCCFRSLEVREVPSVRCGGGDVGCGASPHPPRMRVHK